MAKDPSKTLEQLIKGIANLSGDNSLIDPAKRRFGESPLAEVYPDVLRPGEKAFQIRHTPFKPGDPSTSPMTNNQDRTMQVDLTPDDPWAHVSRCHEAKHAQISPSTIFRGKRKESLHPIVVTACEDVRVAHELIKDGLPIAPPSWDESPFSEDVTRGFIQNADQSSLLCWLTASYGIEMARRLVEDVIAKKERLQKLSLDGKEELPLAKLYDIARQTQKLILENYRATGKAPTFKDTMKGVKYLKEYLLTDPEAPPSNSPGCCSHGKTKSELESEIEESVMSYGDVETGRKPKHGRGGNWAPAFFEAPPLCRKAAIEGKKPKAKTSRLIGVRPTRTWNWKTSKKIFSKKTIASDIYGTVVFDQSGSMGRLRMDVIKLAHLIPAGTIATYSSDGATGRISIVGRNGMLASTDDMAPFGGANCIDGPAVAWLAKQAEPRIWVSDGSITGIGDGGLWDAVAEDFWSIVKKYRVKRVSTGKEAVEKIKEYYKMNPRLRKNWNAKDTRGDTY